MNKHRCHSYREATGEHVCDRCGFRWDDGDEKPQCRSWPDAVRWKYNLRKRNNEISKKCSD